jgi:hypothetical protein
VSVRKTNGKGTALLAILNVYKEMAISISVK